MNNISTPPNHFQIKTYQKFISGSFDETPASRLDLNLSCLLGRQFGKYL